MKYTLHIQTQNDNELIHGLTLPSVISWIRTMQDSKVNSVIKVYRGKHERKIVLSNGRIALIKSVNFNI